MICFESGGTSTRKAGVAVETSFFMQRIFVEKKK
jgi:hypothetical protein